MKKVLLVPVFATLMILGCDRQLETPPADATTADARPTDCTPLDTMQREAPDRTPAFPWQTRACADVSNVDFDVVVLSTELESPWAVEPLPDGNLLVTEKAGRMRIVSATGEVGPPISGVPAVVDNRQGGLLDVALSPNFATDRTIFWSYTEPRDDGNGTSVARGVLSEDGTRLDQVQVILRTQPSFTNGLHFGSRIVFNDDGTMFVTIGERSDQSTRYRAQLLDNHYGKMLRIQTDGSPAPGNPFIGQEGVMPEIWSYGHRNTQAADVDEQGRLWIIEHGPRGGDELNLAEAGKNYGWPLITYGIDYGGGPIVYTGGPAEGAGTQREGLEQPVYFWDPVIAPSGAQFYTGDAFPEWRGNLFVGALRGAKLVRLVIENDRVVGEEHLLADRGERIRDVRQGPDGLLYIVTDGGQLWKITPRG